MFSAIDRSVVYDVDTDITEHDINIVSDLWTMAGRQVYRGARDPNYTHANVYWLYDPEDLDRVGVSEHVIDAPANVNLLWYKDNPFGTLLQEDGWTEGDTIWKELPRIRASPGKALLRLRWDLRLVWPGRSERPLIEPYSPITGLSPPNRWGT